MICGHERVPPARGFSGNSNTFFLSCSSLLAALCALGCDNSGTPPMPTEAMARRQWELSVQQNRRDLEKEGAVSYGRAELAAKDREIAKLKQENEELRERIARIENEATRDAQVIREFPDGIVWIDRGEEDELELKKVYQVLPASGAEDPRARKSDIQIVKFLGAHLAEARVLDRARSIAVGDRIRTRGPSTPVAEIPKIDPNEGEVVNYEVELEMAEISLGTREGLVKGERLHVYRALPTRQYLGQVRVLNAAPTKAFVQMETVGGSKPVAIEPGDRVCRHLPEGLDPVTPRRVD